ncbi:g7153 [Coccomyxa viridis]|uniref:G7153 protein n=1 Tax=Coccomyxa viridis TaxID=1274662 RepID=A0ABP1G3S6_9CHLO
MGEDVSAEAATSPEGAARATVFLSPANGHQDAFDRDDFDAVAYINEMFPTENSLSGLDPLITSLKQKIRKVDSEILVAVRQQSSSGSRARQDLTAAKAAIEELFGKIREIRRKAEASEIMVQEICRDIRKLDFAKTHLTHTITALRRLAMLVNAVDQLQRAVERGEYAEAARLLEAVQQLAAHFQAFGSVPKVAELSGRVSALQMSLQLSAMREFELLGTGEDKPNPLLLERLRACCLVIDVLGFKAREELIESVCQKEVGVYQQIFSTTGETAQIERAERRYAWLRRRLNAKAEIWAIFPESWRLTQRMCLLFAQVTRTHLAEILDNKAPELSNNVEGLLVAVKATNDFESDMARRFGGSGADSAADEDEERSDAGHEADDNSPASRVRQRYERMFRDRDNAELLSDDAARAADAAREAANAAARTAFHGSIATVFTKHLRVYIDAEEKGLRETLETLIKEESWKPMEDAAQTNVLRSASELFAVIKKSLQRCSRFVSRGEPMLRLMGAFQRVLRAYAMKLVTRLPKTAAGGTTGSAGAGTQDWYIRLNDEDVVVVCTIIATAEYCNEVVGALGRNVSKTLDPPFGAQVNVSEEEDEFQLLITACLSVLILGTETKLDAALVQMTRLPWASLESVGDQSDFVTSFSRVLAETAPRIGPALSPLHFRYFCDKLAVSFCPRFYEYIFRCRKVSEAGSQQLLLDTQAIKALLLDFPSAGKPSEAVHTSFSGYVAREMGKAEALLKVVGSRPENLVDNFFTLMPSGSPADFQRILELKVMRRNEQQSAMDAFNKRIGRPSAAAPYVRAAAPVPAPVQAPALMPQSTPLVVQAPRQAQQPPPVSAPAAAAASASAPYSNVTPDGQRPPLTPSTSNRGQALPTSTSQEFVSRFRFGGGSGASARSSAAAAGEKMRETMAGSLAAMKNLNLGFNRNTRE